MNLGKSYNSPIWKFGYIGTIPAKKHARTFTIIPGFGRRVRSLYHFYNLPSDIPLYHHYIPIFAAVKAPVYIPS